MNARDPRGRRVRAQVGDPLYRLIATQIREEIARGDFPVGGLLPPETELCTRFAASRHTMREALRILTEQGLILRRAGAGSTVIALTPQRVFAHTVSSFEQWLDYPQDTYRDRLAARHENIDAETAKVLRVPIGSPWFHISALRRVGDERAPLCWTDIYVHPQYAGVVRSKDHGSTPVYEQIEKLYGVATARVQIDVFASRIAGEIATALQVKSGHPSLTIVRRYFSPENENFEVTVTVHPENRYVYSMEFTREFRAK
jgi:GntR family transcriptional regulator